MGAHVWTATIIAQPAMLSFATVVSPHCAATSRTLVRRHAAFARQRQHLHRNNRGRRPAPVSTTTIIAQLLMPSFATALSPPCAATSGTHARRRAGSAARERHIHQVCGRANEFAGLWSCEPRPLRAGRHRGTRTAANMSCVHASHFLTILTILRPREPGYVSSRDG